MEKITSTSAYKQASTFASDDENTKVHFVKSYNNTKVISAFVPIAEGYGINSINERIMREAGVNCLMKITIDLQMEADKDGAILMCPRLAFEINGATNGTVSNTKYFTGLVVGKGIPFNEKMAKEELDKVIRANDRVATFAKALKEIKEKEKSNGDYPLVWSLQK